MCVRPLRATIPEFGKPIFHIEGETEIPCGKCHECITLRACDWGLRTQHELGDHDENCCLTLTYNDESLPDYSDRKVPFQKFMKRLRKSRKKKISYLASHELGSNNGRIHHHVLLFGTSFDDMRMHKKTPKGTQLYTSKSLAKLWSTDGNEIGWCNIGEASAKAGHYIAAYALKGSTYTHIDDHGEINYLSDSMDCSKKPAIGLNYLRRNHRNIVNKGERLPRYYIKKMKEYQELTHEDIRKIYNKKGFEEIRLMREMYDSYCIYDQDRDYDQRTSEEILTKYRLYRKKITQDGELRKKFFTKSENVHYNYLKEEYTSYLSLEENYV
jgi:hypothetical protein